MFGLNCRYLLAELRERWRKPAGYLDLPEENMKDLRLLEEVKKEWYVAKNYFNEVTEPALIDYAIHNMEAAERRLVYLIETLRDKYPDGIWFPAGMTYTGEEAHRADQDTVGEG